MASVLLKLQGVIKGGTVIFIPVHNIHLLAMYDHRVCSQGFLLKSMTIFLVLAMFNSSSALSHHSIKSWRAGPCPSLDPKRSEEHIVSKFNEVTVGMDALTVISLEKEQEEG